MMVSGRFLNIAADFGLGVLHAGILMKNFYSCPLPVGRGYLSCTTYLEVIDTCLITQILILPDTDHEIFKPLPIYKALLLGTIGTTGHTGVVCEY